MSGLAAPSWGRLSFKVAVSAETGTMTREEGPQLGGLPNWGSSFPAQPFG